MILNRKIRGSFCVEETPKPTGLVIFGASGDLTSRKLVPSLFNLYKKILLPDQFYILGAARSSMDSNAFRNKMKHSIEKEKIATTDESVQSFLKRCFYLFGDYHSPQLYTDLNKRMRRLDTELLAEKNHIFYLATPPSVYKNIIQQLGASGLSDGREPNGESVRIVIEKPFGHDLESAMDLDRALNRVFVEPQIYRIDHYLGKETVQNILLFRFANSIFEPIWNRRYIDNIQITVAEHLGVEHRAGYFEQAGLLRDMFQNHMLQMLSLVAMEPPPSFDPDRVRDEKVKLLRAIRPFNTDELQKFIVRGQYGAAPGREHEFPAYTDEPGVSKNSRVETFIAGKLFVDNWRWQGVPFYLRAGKRLERKTSRIAVSFKNVPHSMFYPLTPNDLNPNVLIFNVQPQEGISLRIQAKHPGPKLCMDSLEMDFYYKDVFEEELPDAYERILLDCMLEDQTLLIRHDDMEVSWSLITPVLKTWNKGHDPLHIYDSGSWGPKASFELLQKDGRSWVEV